MKMCGKVIVVTGAGNGIGRELALDLLRRGALVAAIDNNAAHLRETEQLSAQIAPRLSGIVLDVTDSDAVSRLPERVVDLFGSPDGLINCAGIIQPFEPLHDLSESVIHRVMNVNLFGKLRMIRAFLPHLMQRPEAQIVNVASIGGVVPVPGQAIYGTSKAAVKLLTEALYAEMLGTKIEVSLVIPGLIATNIIVNSNVGTLMANDQDDRRTRFTMPADRAARNILDGVEAGRFRIFVDRPARIMDTFYRLMPNFSIRFLAVQMKDRMADIAPVQVS